MGLFRDDAGKTEKATPKRLGDARQKGRTPISREFTMASTLLIAVLVLENTGFWLVDKLQTILTHGFSLKIAELGEGEVDAIVAYVTRLGGTVAPPYLFLLGTFVLATLVAGYGQIGFKVSTQVLGIKFEKLNPINNLSKTINLAAVMKTALSALKLVTLGSVLYFVLRAKWGVFATMHGIDDLQISIRLVAEMAFTVFFWIAFIVLLLSIGDIAWQRYEFQQSMMMSKQDVGDERKQSEGDPLIKSRLRSAQMEVMRQRMIEEVPKADVVITNPTHFSVAIRYDRTSNAAPQVVAKGVDELAMKIREVAAENDVAIMEDPPLARAIYRAVKVGQEIPERFYQAVAAVLSQIYRLRDSVA